MPEPSPYSSAFRWAWYLAKEYRARFWVSTVAFSLIAAGVTAYLTLPKHPAPLQTFLAAVLGIAGAVVLTGAISILWALAAAPYQQRNALRGELSQSSATIATLRTTPVTQAHGDQLRNVATMLMSTVEHPHKPLEYGAQPDTWHTAFGEHFPALGIILDKIADAQDAGRKLRERLDREAKAAGIDSPPWLYELFAPGLAWRLEQRSKQGLLQGPSDFQWRSWSGTTCAGDPARGGLQIFTNAPDVDPGQLKRQFEEFVGIAETWAEAREIRISVDICTVLCEMAQPMLEVAANTDPITTRCFLCRGTPASATSTAIPGT